MDGLFQPFERLGRERTGHDGGHGLGLAIVRAIADAHGATLTANAPEAAWTSRRASRPGRRKIRPNGRSDTPRRRGDVI